MRLRRHDAETARQFQRSRLQQVGAQRAGLSVKYDISPNWTFTSVTTRSEYDIDFDIDYDFTPNLIGDSYGMEDHNKSGFYDFGQEFRLAYDKDGKILDSYLEESGMLKQEYATRSRPRTWPTATWARPWPASTACSSPAART